MSTLEQKIQAKLDELNKLKEKQRKKDNQQKIILGALVMKECENNSNFSKQILDIINSATDRDKNRLQSFVDKLDATKQEPKPAESESFFIEEDVHEISVAMEIQQAAKEQASAPAANEPNERGTQTPPTSSPQKNEPAASEPAKEPAPKLDIRTLANQRMRF